MVSVNVFFIYDLLVYRTEDNRPVNVAMYLPNICILYIILFYALLTVMGYALPNITVTLLYQILMNVLLVIIHVM